MKHITDWIHKQAVI